MDKEESIKIIKEFSKKLAKAFSISKIIFFGSRARGEEEKFSDIDLIIVSDDFKDMDFFERVSKMYDYWTEEIPVDFLCYTKKEFNKLHKKVSIVKDALDYGIVIK